MKSKCVSTWLYLILSIFSIPVSADQGNLAEIPTDVLHATASFIPQQVESGAQGELIIEMNLAPNHHAYLDRFKLSIEHPSDMIHLGTFNITPTVEFFDKISRSKKQGVAGSATMTAIFETVEKLPPSEINVQIALTYQACTKDYCLLPKTIKIPAQIRITEGHNHPKISGGFKEALSKGVFWTFLFVFIAGILTSLTPCVYPMIPITLAVIRSRGKNISRWHAFTHSFVYISGIGLMYASLGLFAASTGSLFGSVLASPWVTGIIALLFVIMAMSMFGFYDLEPPEFIRKKLAAQKTGRGIAGAFVSGLIAGVVASPCVGPVLVGLLTYIAQTQDQILGFFLLFTFAMGFGVLLLVVGVFGNLLQSLPKSGPWMEEIKVFFGTIMLCTAAYTISPLLPKDIYYGIIFAILLIITTLFGAFAPSEKNRGRQLHQGVLRAIWLFSVIGLSAILLSRFKLIPQTSIPSLGINTTEQSDKAKNGIKWQNFSESTIAQAKHEQKPVIIDFWAEWCEACHELDKHTFTDPRVIQLSEKFVMIKIDATESTEEITKHTSKYKVVGLPTIIFIDHLGNIMHDMIVTGFESGEEFLLKMQKASQEKK